MADKRDSRIGTLRTGKALKPNAALGKAGNQFKTCIDLLASCTMRDNHDLLIGRKQRMKNRQLSSQLMLSLNHVCRIVRMMRRSLWTAI